MRCGCAEASVGLLCGLSLSVFAWRLVAPASWHGAIALGVTITLALTAVGSVVGRLRGRKA
jgi:hypothetical protein